jgi:hypothetical protein
MVEARKLVGESKQRAWKAMFKRQLIDWDASDYVQTMSMAKFLFEGEPAKFLGYLKRLRSGDEPGEALEGAYHASLSELEERWARWVAAKR